MGKLTTHVLDIHGGQPAAGVRIALYTVDPSGAKLIGQHVTGVDGRIATPLLEGDAFQRGRYELVFGLADYFRARGVAMPDPAFIEAARIAIGIAFPEQHYHVPLLITPWSYSVYRGG